MGNNRTESQNLSLQVWEWARELSVSCKEGSLEPGGQQGRWSPRSSRAEPLATDAKGDQRGRSSTVVCGAQLSQQWSGTCLSYTLKVVFSTLPGLLITVLAPLMASGEFPQELICGRSCSADMAVLVTCADILDVPLCQMHLTWLR